MSSPESRQANKYVSQNEGHSFNVAEQRIWLIFLLKLTLISSCMQLQQQRVYSLEVCAKVKAELA